MYFLTALVCTVIAGVLWFFFKDRKELHLDFLTIIYGAATLMWLIDCFFSVAEGEPFLDFEDPQGGWIALATLVGGVFLWNVVSFIYNHKEKTIKA